MAERREMSAVSKRVGTVTVAVALVVCAGSLPRTQGDGRVSRVATNQENVPEWAVTREPTVAVGELERADGVEFHRIVSALRLADGRIVVADAGSSEVRLFSANGRHIVSLGGKGDGPTEFRTLQALALITADSVLAYQSTGQKFVVFPLSGGQARTGSLQPAPPDFLFPTMIGMLSDGSIMAVATAPAAPATTITRAPMGLLRYRLDGRLLNHVARLPGRERVSVRTGPAVTTHQVPFGRTSLYAATGDRIVTMDSHEPVLRYYSPRGQVLRSVQLSRAPRPVASAHWNRFVDSVARAVPAPQQPALRRMLEDLPRSSTGPIATRLVVDRSGHTWIELDGSLLWLVLDETGSPVARVRMPLRFTPVEIGSDYMLGIWRDDVDVESIRLYGLSRKAG